MPDTLPCGPCHGTGRVPIDSFLFPDREPGVRCDVCKGRGWHPRVPRGCVEVTLRFACGCQRALIVARGWAESEVEFAAGVGCGRCAVAPNQRPAVTVALVREAA